jgi:hypothetical protein
MASPNMNLEIPFVLVTTDPLWAQYINDSLELIDEHDHSPGKGVLITPAGMNINADLDMDENNLTGVRTVRFESQASTPAGIDDLDIIYVKNNELCYRDDAGQEVQLTLNGTINVSGGIGVIAGLVAPASATYSPVSETFIWLKDTDEPAKMIMSDIIMYEFNDPLSFPLTLKSQSLGAAMTLLLPNTPVTTGRAFLALGGDDQINPQLAAAATGVADINKIISVNGTDGLNYEATLLKNESIDDRSLTYIKLASRGTTEAPGPGNPQGSAALSNSSGTFSTASTSFVDVTNCTTYITPKNQNATVEIELVPDGSALGTAITASAASGEIRLLIDSVPVALWSIPTTMQQQLTLVKYVYKESAAPGAHTYQLQARTTGAGTMSITRGRLFVKEM